MIGISPIPAFGQEDVIYAVRGHDLLRLDMAEYGLTEVATLDTDEYARAMTFDREGRLIALFEDESIRAIDTESGATTLLIPGPPDLMYGFTQFGSLAEGSDGWLYLLDSGTQMVKRIDPRTGASTLLGAHPDPDLYWGSWVFTLGRYGDGLLALGYTDDVVDRPYPLFSLGEATGSFSTLEGAGDWYGQGLDFDSEGHVWVAEGPGFIAPPLITLLARDLETGERIEGKPTYDMFGAVFPFAVQRGGAEGHGACRGDQALCLLENRFRVEVDWQDGSGAEGSGHPAYGSSTNAGLFWFFSEDNWELSVKMLEGCSLTGHYWFFLSGTTDVGFTVTVTDTRTGEERFYENEVGQSTRSVIDLEAFDGCSRDAG